MEVVVKLALIHELGVFGAGGLELDSNFEVCLYVNALEDFPERPFVYLPYYFVVLAYLLRHLRHTTNIL